MIKSIVLLAVWFISMFLSYKFVRSNIKKVEENKDKYFDENCKC